VAVGTWWVVDLLPRPHWNVTVKEESLRKKPRECTIISFKEFHTYVNNERGMENSRDHFIIILMRNMGDFN
jgi:hypothetical protein